MKGIVVDHKESGVRYAVSEKNFNPKIHKRVRDLRPGETVIGYQPRSKPTKTVQDSQGRQPAYMRYTKLQQTLEQTTEGSIQDSKTAE